MSIYFSAHNVDFEIEDPARTKKWISDVISKHGKKVGRINYLFANDDYVYDVNIKFLQHDTYTDIITFDFVQGDLVSGDIVISMDRVGENASKFGVSFRQELNRVLIHGVLHLLGFKDKSDAEAAAMRAKENESLMLLDAME